MSAEAVAAAPIAEEATPVVYYSIESNDRVVLKISEQAIKQSATLSNSITNLGYSAENAESMVPIPIEKVNGKTLKLVVEWCEHHKADPVPEAYPSGNTVLPVWDRKFVDIEHDALTDLVNASNFLEVMTLLTYCCKFIAGLAKGMSPEEMRVFFCIPTDEEDEKAERFGKEKTEASATSADTTA
ncbi:Skp1-related protein [Caenorhabditis elegans]|uniref:Skp1-related protein n=1 Tax=Caenorhabditis elegans TaxID=6239 RepID=G5EE88_CAEEL|nr:Skp1-related protein [Caenorhabditis elegans]AAL34104.1 SKR-15 [Caenorhabditis elegans]CCD64807.1 Skp1-related protein [Caenorhabditis elegans]|eukprot:NP_494662.1 SKp1 Related (ubiquitin ligase complex component) [Caenorhabditis elegans]